MEIRAAQPADFMPLHQHLTDAGLVLAELPDQLEHFWLAFDDDRLIGSVGLEVYGDAALLRSLAVGENQRNRGVARQLINQAVAWAEGHGIKSLVLLTETAPQYFLRCGFVLMLRQEVAAVLLQSSEFRGACPESAIVMRKNL
jgi:amino-acid N-acetyltransferase